MIISTDFFFVTIITKHIGVGRLRILGGWGGARFRILGGGEGGPRGAKFPAGT